RMTIPRSGRWHVMVDMGGYVGRVNAGVRILPGALPPARQQMPNLGSIVSNAAAFETEDPPVAEADREFDVFVCHAGEDKDSVVRPLALALQEQGLAVWYDEFELRIGDSL